MILKYIFSRHLEYNCCILKEKLCSNVVLCRIIWWSQFPGYSIKKVVGDFVIPSGNIREGLISQKGFLSFQASVR